MEILINEINDNENFNFNSNFIFKDKIANGSFGTVIHAIDIQNNKEVAIKIINKNGAKKDLISKMKEEVSILKKLNHKNIVQYFDYTESISKLYISMEYIKYGTLKQYIKTHKNISEKDASIIIKKLLSAVEYLHNNQICHRDIKPENIMFSKENDLTSIKLIDFGLSYQNFNNLLISDYCGTLLYMAPEQIEKKSYNFTVDIWSIGIILYMLLNNGQHPFYNNGDLKKEFLIKLKNWKFNFCNNISFMGNSLIKKLLEINPSWRYTANKAIRHPWITRNINDDIPKTFNEILSMRNNFKNAKFIMLISIFLNFFKKNEKKIFFFSKGFFWNKKDKKNLHGNFYKIGNEYINKVLYYNNKKKIEMNKIKQKCFDILTKEELNKIKEEKRNSIKRNSIRRISIHNLIFTTQNSKNHILSNQKILKTPKKIKKKEQKIKSDIQKNKYKLKLNFQNNSPIKIQQKKSLINLKPKPILSEINSIENILDTSLNKIRTSRTLKYNLYSYSNTKSNYLSRNHIKNILKKEESISISPNQKLSISPNEKQITKILYLNSNNKDNQKNFNLLPKVNFNIKKNIDNIDDNISIIPLILPNNRFKSKNSKKILKY